jgi:hypothetical protein
LCLQKLFLTQNRVKIRDKPIKVIIDFAWNHKSNAENDVLTIVNAENNDIIFSQVIQRCSEPSDTHDISVCVNDYLGSLKGMESFATQEAFKWLQESDINITTLIYDNDSSTYVAANNAYTNIIE